MALWAEPGGMHVYFMPSCAREMLGTVEQACDECMYPPVSKHILISVWLQQSAVT